MLIPQDLMIKASDVLKERMGALAVGQILNGRLDISAVIVNPGGTREFPKPEDQDFDEATVLTFTVEQIISFIEDEVAADSEEERESDYAFAVDGLVVCVLASDDESGIQAEVFQKMKE